MFSRKRRRFLLSTLVVILALAGLIIIVLSPLAKFLLEKYDLTLLGREVKVGRVYLNPFTGFVQLNQLRIYEDGKDTVFFSANRVRGNFAIIKLFYKEYEISDLEIDQPVGYIIHKKEFLNFNDLIERFTPKGSSKGKPVHFNILSIKIKDGEFHYREKVIPIDYFIRKVNIECTGKRWDTDTIAASFSFESGNRKGIAKGNFTIDTQSLDYRLATEVHDFDLELIRQYLWELINYGMFRARLEAKFNASGNFRSINDIILSGKFAIEDFHFGKTVDEDYASFEKLSLGIAELSPRNKKYLFDSVTLENPYFLFERFDSLDNIQALFGKKASNISDVTNQKRFNLVIQLSRYIESLSASFFASQYRVNSLSVTNGDLNFSDYSLPGQFAIRANELFFKADSISKMNNHVKFHLRTAIFPFGKASATLTMNPVDSGYLELAYRIEKIPVTFFNPYILSYTSYLLNKGTIELSGDWKVRGGDLKGDNHLILVDPRIGERLKSKESRRMPLPFLMTFVRERGNIIDYRIPISGNLKNPKFHLRDVVLDVFENLFVKPATIPYGLEVKSAEQAIESSVVINWKLGQAVLEKEQVRFIKQITKFLKKNPAASIDVYPQHYEAKEKEHILFYEARKKYMLSTRPDGSKAFTPADSLALAEVALKKIANYLVKDLTTITRDTTMFTIQDKCNYFLGDNTVDLSYQKLLDSREKSLRAILLGEGIESQVKIYEGESVIPYDGSSCFRIHYNGVMPKSLLDSYTKLDDLNNGLRRRKYFNAAGR